MTSLTTAELVQVVLYDGRIIVVSIPRSGGAHVVRFGSPDVERKVETGWWRRVPCPISSRATRSAPHRHHLGPTLALFLTTLTDTFSTGQAQRKRPVLQPHPLGQR